MCTYELKGWSRRLRVLVTGATGYLRGFLVSSLLERDHRLRVTVRHAEQANRFDDEIDVVVADLSQRLDWGALVDGVDAVIHLAAAVRDVSAEVKRAVNRDATARLAESACLQGIGRFIYASTSPVYGPQSELPCSESAEAAPVGDYAISKLEGEQALLTAVGEPAGESSPGLQATVLRFGIIYGRQSGRLGEVASRRLTDTPNESPVQLVHVDDAVRGVVLALERPLAGAVLNVGDITPVTVAELARLAGVAVTPNAKKRLRLPEPALAMDVSRATELLDFRPQFPSLRDALAAGVA